METQEIRNKMSVQCSVCNEEFKSQKALSKHIWWKHQPDGRNYHASAAPVVTEKPFLVCPVCGSTQPFRYQGEGRGITVCFTCLCKITLNDGSLYAPPPERCFYEDLGMECRSPAHKHWHKVYQEQLAQQKAMI